MHPPLEPIENSVAMRPHRNSARYLHAFSLIELMLVVAIIGVLSALAIPNLTRRIKDSEAEVEIGRVQAGLTRLRNISRTSTSCVTVAISGNSLVGTPYIDCDPLANVQTATTLTFDSSLVSLGTITGPGFSAPFTFQKSGGHTLAGPATLTVTNVRSGNLRTLKIFPATGFVRLQP